MTPKYDLQTVYLPKRLCNELENIKKYPLTVLEAPSGFGKTTALEKFFSQPCFKDALVIKHTLFADNTAQYWEKFCRALSAVDGVCAEALEKCGVPCGENMPDICEIFGELECEKPVYIILDNLSDTADGIDEFIAALSSRTSENLHIAVSVQSLNPSKNSFRYMCAGRAFFISAEDFTFTDEDCRAYFESAGVVLTDTELCELMSITGGWIFAVYLQLLFYTKNKHFEKGILDTLIKKAFFDRLGDDERRFFLSVSMFKSLSAAKGADLSGKDADFVRNILDGCGFVKYDSKTGEYCFHNLISEYLRKEFDKLSDELKEKYYLKAADSELACGEKLSAFELYYKAGAYEKIFSMPHTSYDLCDIENPQTHKMIFDILDKTPRAVKVKYPESMVPLAFILFFLNEQQKLFETVGEIFEVVGESKLSQHEKNRILGETELLVSFSEFNDIAKMSAHHKRAYQLLGTKASLINMKSTWSFGSPSVMCLYHSHSGELDKELSLMDECMPCYYKLTGGHGSGSEYAMRAEAELLHGNFDAAETLAHRAMFEAREKQQDSVYQCGLFVLANTAVVRADESRLFEVLFSMSESAASNYEDMCRYTLDMFLGYIYAYTYRAEKAAVWLAKGDIQPDRIAPMTIPFAHIVYGKILLENKEYAKLCAFCPFARNAAKEIPAVLPQIYLYIYESAAYNALGEAKKAAEALNNALSLALPDGIYMPFAQNYARIRSVLDVCADKTALRKISAFGDEYEKSAKLIGSGKPKLSPREREVAGLIREGLTNKQIAARLYVSLSTVKMTISNIFDKTGIKSREQLNDIKI